MDEGIEFNHWAGTVVLSKHESMQGEVRETAMKGKQVIFCWYGGVGNTLCQVIFQYTIGKG